jgi:DNA-binding NarL/FixJ family response regulator
MQAAEAHDALAMVTYEGRPAALLIADGEAATARLREAAELAGCRIMTVLGSTGALAAPEDLSAAQLIVSELEGAGDSCVDQLLDVLARTAARGRAVIVSAPPALTDVVAARAWGPDIHQLSDAGEEELVEAIGHALQGTAARLRDNGRGQLQQLSQEAARIASALAALSERAETGEPGDASPNEEGEVDSVRIRAIIRARRLREHYFPPDLFADPAWDMLLDLMAARLDGQRVAVSSLCIAAAVPATTALRWIKALTEQGLFVRVADPADGRRVYIELSDGAAGAVVAYLKAAQRVSSLTL